MSPTNKTSSVTVSLLAGNYYVLVEASVAGAYDLHVRQFPGEGTTCTGPADCGPGLVCRIPHNATSKVCAKPECSDGVDDDNDGKLDYPDDPGCNSPSDNDETDDCPAGPGCPQCSNQLDDDGDGMIDYPADTTCHSAGDRSEACPSSEGVAVLTMPATIGDTSMALDDVHPICSIEQGAFDRTYRLDLPALTSLSLNAASTFNAIVELLDSTCNAALSCGFHTAAVGALAAGRYYVVVDGDFAVDFGTFTLNVAGKIADDASCESALAQAGALTCTAPRTCKGLAGSRTCKP